jgi:co-chaperonin GroES (HSP10)
MRVKVKRGLIVHTKDGKTHKQGEVLEVGKGISQEEYEWQRTKFERYEKEDIKFNKALKDQPDKR